MYEQFNDIATQKRLVDQDKVNILEQKQALNNDYADIKADIKVLGSNNIIEIWDKKLYEDFLNQDLDIEKLAEDVLGGLDFNDETE